MANSNADFFSLIATLEPVNVPITKSDGGFHYLYEADSPAKKDDWRADGWHWRQQGTSSLPFNGVACKKFYFYSVIDKIDGKQVTSPAFKREVYWHPDFPLRFLVRYIGDSSVQVALPHGNAKSKEKLESDFVMTRKSKRIEMKERPGFAQSIYKEMIGEAPDDANIQIVAAPRDLKQVRNAQQYERRKLVMNQDTNHNLKELAEETKFIKDIVSEPDLIVLCHRSETWEKVGVQLNRSDIPHLCWSYNTIDLGDINVSVLMVRYEEFQDSPAIPVLIMVHESKMISTHRYFWQKVSEIFPVLGNAKNVYLVTDAEHAVVNSIQEFFPSLDIFFCWNRILSNARSELESIGITAEDELAQYEADIRQLLEKESEVAYQLDLAERTKNPDNQWHPEFTNYFMKHVDSEIDKTGSWKMIQHNIQSSTINESEFFNCVISDLQEWVGRPVDAIIISLERLSHYVDVEILRSRYGLGQWSMDPNLAHLYNIAKDAPTFPSSVAPHLIVDRIRAAREILMKESKLRRKKPTLLKLFAIMPPNAIHQQSSKSNTPLTPSNTS